jgi:hypothetical protein
MCFPVKTLKGPANICPYLANHIIALIWLYGMVLCFLLSLSLNWIVFTLYFSSFFFCSNLYYIMFIDDYLLRTETIVCSFTPVKKYRLFSQRSKMLSELQLYSTIFKISIILVYFTKNRNI